MKSILYIIAFLFLSCTNNAEEKGIASNNHQQISNDTMNVSLPKNKADRKKYHTTSDTVIIYTKNNDTLKFIKNDFNDIVDNFPELTGDNINSPDYTFSKSTVWVDLVDSSGNKKHLSFGSEVGKDEFYILYAYFLKNKNGIEKYSTRRNNLIKIYTDLNSIFGELNYGGTYFGHQSSRIEGYAEFSIYWFSHYQDFFSRPYDISKQKSLYIASLKQLIRDEVAIDNNVVEKHEKAKRILALFETIDDLDKLITDNFYLRMAQSFNFDNY